MSAFTVVVDVALLALVLVRQRRVRPVPGRLSLRFPIILGLLGLWQLLDSTGGRHLSGSVLAVLLASLVVGAGVFGFLRAMTVRLWPQPPFVLRQGTGATMALWALSVALHFVAGWAITSLKGPGDLADSSFLLYLGITYGVQNTVVFRRSEPIRAAMGPVDPVSAMFGASGLRGFWFGSNLAGRGPGGPGRPGPGFLGGAARPAPHDPGVIDARSEELPPDDEGGTPSG